MSYAAKGDWVQIHQIVLPAGERAPQVPAETKIVPLELWVKGFLLDNKAEKDNNVTIRTLAGRELSGRLVSKNPRYEFDYGDPQPELIAIGPEIRAILEEKADA